MTRKATMLAFLLMGTAVLTSCKESTPPCELQGRWVVKPSTLYEFTDSLQYTIYTTSPGVFGTLADAIPNPHRWWMQNDSLRIDLNFGNVATYDVQFDCECNVVDLTNAWGTQTWTKEGFDLSTCR